MLVRSDGEPKKRQVKGGIIFRQEANKERGYHEADTVVFTADGAEWIWIMVEDRFKGAVQIVDFYHAAELTDMPV